jgi:hypothetical protein
MIMGVGRICYCLIFVYILGIFILILMKRRETRAGKYGRNLGVLVRHILSEYDERYRKRFFSELNDYSFEKRRRGEKTERGDYELDEIYEIDIRKPGHLAKLIKEGIHLMYQKDTAKRVLEALVREIKL